MTYGRRGMQSSRELRRLDYSWDPTSHLDISSSVSPLTDSDNQQSDNEPSDNSDNQPSDNQPSDNSDNQPSDNQPSDNSDNQRSDLPYPINNY